MAPPSLRRPRRRTAHACLALVAWLGAGCYRPSSAPAAAPATAAAASPAESSSLAAAPTAEASTAASSDAAGASPSATPPRAATQSSVAASDPQQQQQRAPAQARDPEEEFPPVADTPQNVAVVASHPDPTRPDPRHGRFALADATAGLPPGDTLVAEIETSMGTFTCTLLAAEAPVTVANFVGLARGVRDFWDPVAGRWTRRPFYDGSVFHRVIPGFMVQGGDILRTGRGGPGYEIRDENTAAHDAPGQLCMANHGPNTGGAQFFITELALPRLNGSYSVFGRCAPAELVARIARVPRSPRNQPIAPVTIQHVTVHR